MDQPLPVAVPEALVSGPFTPAMAAAAGIGRAMLDRMVRVGTVRRLRRGVYLGAAEAETPALRAQALGLVLPPGAVVVDRAAAWVHGMDAARPWAGDLDAVGRRHRSPGQRFGARRPLADRDAVELNGVRVTTVLRTACDLARLLPSELGLAVVDAVLRDGRTSHRAVLAELPRHADLPGAARLRRLALLADDRALSAAESVLRLRWLEAGLPTPAAGLSLPCITGPVRVALAAPFQRFAVMIVEARTEPPPVAPDGWWLLAVSAARVVLGDAELVRGHLRSSYHRQLLRQAG